MSYVAGACIATEERPQAHAHCLRRYRRSSMSNKDVNKRILYINEPQTDVSGSDESRKQSNRNTFITQQFCGMVPISFFTYHNHTRNSVSYVCK